MSVPGGGKTLCWGSGDGKGEIKKTPILKENER